MNKKMVTITLDKERNLYFNLNSLEIIEDITGKSIDKITENMNMKTLKAILFAGLVHEDKDLTPEAVGDMVGFDDIANVSEAISKAFENLK